MDQNSLNSKSSNSQRKPQQGTPPAGVPYNAGSAKDVAAAEKRSRSIMALRKEGLRQIMDSQAGRAWMYGMLEEMGPMQNAFTGNSQTFFNCGKQYLGQHLIAQLLEDHLEAYILMNKEHKPETRQQPEQEFETEEA